MRALGSFSAAGPGQACQRKGLARGFGSQLMKNLDSTRNPGIGSPLRGNVGNPEALFESPHGMAKGGRRDAQPDCRARETALLRDGRKCGKFCEFVPLHC
jgi:hypothetical protein